MKKSNTHEQISDDVIKNINQAPTPETCLHLGNNDILSQDDVAAKYAYESALMVGKLDISTVIRQLEHLKDNGAVFNIERAFHKIIALRDK